MAIEAFASPVTDVQAAGHSKMRVGIAGWS
jgi:hypothetical protein